MADIEAGTIIRCAMEWSMPEEVEAYNVWAMQCSTGEATDAQLLTALASWVQNGWATVQGIIKSTVDIQEVTVNKIIWSGTEWIVDRYIGLIFPTFAATNVNDLLPHATAAVLQFPTAVPKKRGRMFVPGLTEDQQAGSLLTGGAITALTNLATAVRSTLVAGTAQIFYTVVGKGGQSDYSTSSITNGTLGSQRKRKPGVGI